jgi:cytochrome c peroxidase
MFAFGEGKPTLAARRMSSGRFALAWIPCLLVSLGCRASSDKQSALPESISMSEMAALQSLAMTDMPVPPVDPTNNLLRDESKLSAARTLGHRFFFDPRFSGPLLDPDHKPTVAGALGVEGEVGKVACSSCHVPSSGFLDSRSPRAALSLGAGWTPRRAISLLNVAFGKLFMWDGNRDALWNQIFTPIEKHVEMNSGRLFVAQELAREASYRSAYEELFGPLPAVLDPAQFPLIQRPGCLVDTQENPTDCHGMPGDGAEYDGLSDDQKTAVTRVVVNMGKAIQAYEQMLRCGPGRFDAWVDGDESALTAEEQRGARLFIGKGQCIKCHHGVFMTDFDFHNIGLEPGGPQVLFMTVNDVGAKAGVTELITSALNTAGVFSDDPSVRRFPSEVPPAYEGAFKTPSLRCASLRTSFFHTGQYVSLDDVVAFKNRGGHRSGYVGTSELSPLGLTAAEQADLVAFLKALDALPGNGTADEWVRPPADL